MTRTRHLDEQELITLALHGPAEAVPESHVDQCPACRHEIEAWQRVSDVTRAAVASVPPPGVDLAERILRRTEVSEADAPARPNRRAHPRRARHRRAQWLVTTTGVAVAAAVSVFLALGSTAPSDAMVLATIKRSPSLAATAFKTIRFTSDEVERAPQGYTIIGYRSQGSLSPGSNAFEYAINLVYPGGPPTKSVTYLSDGSLVYLPCEPAWNEIGKRPCTAYPAQRGRTPNGLPLGYLRQARGPVVHLGKRTIGSVETTGYGVTVPVSAYLADALPSERSLEQQSLATAKTLRIDVWSDHRGLPRQLDLTFTQVQATPRALLHITIQERLSYDQVPLQVTVPSRSTVVIAPNLSAALQLANRYNEEFGSYRQRLLHGT